MDSANFCGFRFQFGDSAHNLRNPFSIYGLRLQFVDCKPKFIKHIYYNLFMDSTNSPEFRKIGCSFHKFCCGFELPVFGAVLSNTVFNLFVRGIQNSKQDQRKVAVLRIPR